MKGRNESPDHFELKRHALAWLYGRGARSIGFEVGVRTPEHRGLRVDVAALDHRSIVETRVGPRGGRRRRVAGLVDELIAVECKASRADFLRDASRTDRLLDALAELDRARERLESRLRDREPQLLARESLFDPDPVWRYERSTDPQYRALRRELARLAARLHRATKFERLRSGRLFDRHYVCAPPDTLRAAELPPGWGLLEGNGGGTGCRLVREAPLVPSEPAQRPRVVRRIAQAATRGLLEATGLCVTGGTLALDPAPGAPGAGVPVTSPTLREADHGAPG